MNTMFSVIVLAAFALLAGAVWLWRRQGLIRQVWLMVLMAAIMLGNVAIWTIPDNGGTALVDRAAVPPDTGL